MRNSALRTIWKMLTIMYDPLHDQGLRTYNELTSVFYCHCSRFRCILFHPFSSQLGHTGHTVETAQ